MTSPHFFIDLITSTNSIWTFGFWHIDRARQQQGLVLDPVLRIWDVGLLIISGNVSFYIMYDIPKISYWLHLLPQIQFEHSVFDVWTKRGKNKDSFRSRSSLDPGYWSGNHFTSYTWRRPIIFTEWFWFIYLNRYFHKFKLNIQLLTYKLSERETRTPPGSGFSPDTGQWSVNHFRDCIVCIVVCAVALYDVLKFDWFIK